jgi:hypothetical protein
VTADALAGTMNAHLNELGTYEDARPRALQEGSAPRPQVGFEPPP